MAFDLNDTLVFVKVVDQGSFIAAARSLGLPKTTVSRKVQELETRLGAQLLHRTTRRLGLTEAGTVYYEHCQRIARELEEAEGAVGQLQGGPRGWLRFSVPYSIGIAWISPLLGAFDQAYEKVVGHTPAHLGFLAYTDAAMLAYLTGNQQAVVFGPGLLSDAHTTDEKVELAQIVTATDILEQTALNLLG